MKIERGYYRHFKGKVYGVLGEATHSETRETYVIYYPTYDPEAGAFVRPKDMFLEHVLVDGKSVPRFQRITVKTEMRSCEGCGAEMVLEPTTPVCPRCIEYVKQRAAQ